MRNVYHNTLQQRTNLSCAVDPTLEISTELSGSWHLLTITLARRHVPRHLDPVLQSVPNAYQLQNLTFYHS